MSDVRPVSGAINPTVSGAAVYVAQQQKLLVFGGGNLTACSDKLWMLDMGEHVQRGDGVGGGEGCDLKHSADTAAQPRSDGLGRM